MPLLVLLTSTSLEENELELQDAVRMHSVSPPTPRTKKYYKKQQQKQQNYITKQKRQVSQISIQTFGY
jgi:hypothetical protein